MNNTFLTIVRKTPLHRLIRSFVSLIYFHELRIIKNKFDLIQNGKFIDTSEYSNEKLLKILQHANKNCPYYTKIFRENDINISNLKTFKQIPLLTKDIIVENQKMIVSQNLKPWNFYKMNTGGSTGKPLNFFLSPKNGVIDDLHQKLFLELIGYSDQDIIVSIGGGAGLLNQSILEKNEYWVDTGSNLPYGKWKYPALYLNDKTINLYAKSIIDKEPTIIRGYPSSVSAIAEYFLQKKLKLTTQLKGVILTSEVAHKHQINKISKAFNTTVYIHYGHSELCLFAYTTNKKGKFICSPFYGYVEVLDDVGNQVKKGQEGEVVVTNYHNFAMPFIRYKTGDRVIYGGKDKFGRVLFDAVLGRTQDYIITSDNQKISITALVFGSHFKAFQKIKKWQIIQEHKGKVLIKIVKRKGFTKLDENEIAESFFHKGNVKTSFKYVKDIKKTKLGKYKFVVQNIENKKKK